MNNKSKFFNIINIRNLLRLILNKEKLETIKMLVIMLDFEEPYNFLNDLNMWIGLFIEIMENAGISLG